MSGLVDAVRERTGVETLVTAAGLVALWAVVLDAGPVQVVASLAITALVGLGEVVADAYDLGAVRHLGLGLAAVLGAGVLAVVGDGVAWVPFALGLTGVWLSVDAVQTLRHGPPDAGAGPDPETDGREVYHRYVAGRIQELLDGQRRTRLELAAELDADAEAVDAALALLVERGAVERVGSEYRRSSRDEGGLLGRWRARLARAAGRLARPVAVEFAGGAPGESGAPTPPTGGQRRRDPESGREHEREIGRARGGDPGRDSTAGEHELEADSGHTREGAPGRNDG